MATQTAKKEKPKYRLRAILAEFSTERAEALEAAIIESGVSRNTLWKVKSATMADAYEANTATLKIIAGVVESRLEDLLND